MSEHQTKRTITSIILDCFPSEYNHEVKALRGMMIYARAELKMRTEAVYAVIGHDRGLSKLAAIAQIHSGRRGLGRNGTGAGNGTAHSPQDSESQNGSKEVRKCHVRKKRDNLKRACPTHEIVKVAAVEGNTARRSGNEQTEEAESGFGCHGKEEAKRPERTVEIGSRAEWTK